MRPFAALERLIERFVERPSARLFRTQVQPLQLQRRLERAMETARRAEGGRTVVPNRYTIRLHPDAMASLAARAEPLVAELADGALTFARAHRYLLADRPRVALVANRGVAVGDIVVEAVFERGDRQRAEGAERPQPALRSTTAGDRPRAWLGLSDTALTARSDVAVLHIVGADGRQSDRVLDGRPVTVGRAPDNNVVLGDSRVSRHHARLHVRRGALILTDLGSRNGSRVNGISVTEVALGSGDRIQVGDAVIVVDGVDGDGPTADG